MMMMTKLYFNRVTPYHFNTLICQGALFGTVYYTKALRYPVQRYC